MPEEIKQNPYQSVEFGKLYEIWDLVDGEKKLTVEEKLKPEFKNKRNIISAKVKSMAKKTKDENGYVKGLYRLTVPADEEVVKKRGKKVRVSKLFMTEDFKRKVLGEDIPVTPYRVKK